MMVEAWKLLSPSGNGRKTLVFRPRLQCARRAGNGVALISLEAMHCCKDTADNKGFLWAAAKVGFIRLSEKAAEATAFRRLEHSLNIIKRDDPIMILC
jgi:hypothetical protein